MRILEAIGRPVMAEAWTEAFSEISHNALSGLVQLTAPDSLVQETLKSHEILQIPILEPRQSLAMRRFLEGVRRSHPIAELEVATTKVHVKSGNVSLGLENHKQLRTDRRDVLTLFAKLFGYGYISRPRPYRFNVQLGQTIDKSAQAQREIIHTFNDVDAMPRSIHLGRIFAEISDEATGECLRI